MLADNVKIQTHIHQLRDNIFSNSQTRRQLARFGLFAMIYCLLIFYFGQRVWQSFDFTISLPVYLLALAALALVLPVAAYLLDQGREARLLPQIIAYAGFYWTAFFFYAIILLTGLDLIRMLDQLSGYQLLPTWFMPSQRLSINLVVAVTFLLLAVGTFLARTPRITSFILKVDKPMPRSRPLRIALLSDIHYGSLVSTADLSLLCSRIRTQQPDLILLAGDLIDNSLQLVRQTDFIAQISGLQAPLGIYAVLGNHELVNADKQEIVNFYRAGGIRVLQDETVVLDDQLILAGRNERQTEFSGRLQQHSPSCLLDGINQNLPVILMQHQPAELDLLEQSGVDIALAGHTHRGQLFPLNLLNWRRFGQTGRYKRFGQMQSIISSGYGTWGPPIRLGSRSEIVIIDLQGQPETDQPIAAEILPASAADLLAGRSRSTL